MKKEVKSGVIVELYKLGFQESLRTCSGRVIKSKAVTEDDLINQIVSRGSDLSRAVLHASISLIADAATEMLMRGYSVKAFNAIFSLDVKGTFYENDNKWDGDKHKLVISIRPCKRLKKKLENTSVTVRGMSNVGTSVHSVTDMSTGELNHKLTPGGIIQINGKKVKIAGDNPDNGVSLINQDNGNILTIARDRIVENRASKLVLILPDDIPSGSYKLRVVTQFSSSDRIVRYSRSYTFMEEFLI